MVWKCVIDYTSYVIDYQRLWTLGIQILNEGSQLFKKNNCVIDYTNSVIDYQRGFSRNITNNHILSFGFWMAIKGLYICVTWDEIGERVLLVQNVLSSQKKMREIPRELHCQMLSQRTLGQTLANPLRVHPWIFIVIFFSWRENSSSILLTQWN